LNAISLVVKVAERCNLGCDYCYMYEGADASWKTRPRFLSDKNAELLLWRVDEYLATNQSDIALVELHGGEPLLWGKQRFVTFVNKARELDSFERMELCLQTNGVLLDQEWLDLFAESGVSFSISCDGPPLIHDRHRFSPGGRSSSAAVESAIKLALAHEEARPLFGGVLSVVDLATDPCLVVEYLYELGVREMDLLLPDLTREEAMRRVDEAQTYLCRAFDAWLSLNDDSFVIRFFREYTLGFLGRPSVLDYLGGDLSRLGVVESDGSLQLLDVLRVCSAGAAHTNASLGETSLADFFIEVEAAIPPPAQECRACRAFKACGGGYLPHRYENGSFDHASGYCDALLALHDHVHQKFAAVVPRHAWRPRIPASRKLHGAALRV
jgi:uncharacterized protein